MLLNASLLIAGLIALFYGGNWLVRGASNLAMSFGVSVLVIALTFVAVGTSMPELLVSMQAALIGKSELAIGNVIGSNIANIGLILGATGLITPLSVKAVLLRREIPIMILFSIGVVALTLDGDIDRLDGSILLLAFVAFNLMLYRFAYDGGRRGQPCAHGRCQRTGDRHYAGRFWHIAARARCFDFGRASPRNGPGNRECRRFEYSEPAADSWRYGIYAAYRGQSRRGTAGVCCDARLCRIADSVFAPSAAGTPTIGHFLGAYLAFIIYTIATGGADSLPG